MDSSASTVNNGGGLGLVRSIAKLVRLRHKRPPECDDSTTTTTSLYKTKLPEYLDSSSSVYYEPDGEEEKKKSKQREATEEAVLAGVFACLSALKASYAQLQLAQLPYDPEVIQLADRSIVGELKRLSQLKHHYLSGGYQHLKDRSFLESITHSQIQEQRSLVETFRITTRKLDSDLHSKEMEVNNLKMKLQEATEKNRALEVELQGRDLELSKLTASQFLSALQYTMRSVKTYVRALEKEMAAAEWDLSAAARAIEPKVAGSSPRHRSLAFEAFVCRSVFEGFRRAPADVDRGGLLAEFLEAKAAPLEKMTATGRRTAAFRSFLEAKYESLVSPEMERELFGNGEQRSGEGYPTTALFRCLAEMARRVWMLQRLFWAFEGAEVFVAAAGSRFSEVYMASAAEEDDGDAVPVVGFTVAPGFRVGGVVVQCRVYLERRDGCP